MRKREIQHVSIVDHDLAAIFQAFYAYLSTCYGNAHIIIELCGSIYELVWWLWWRRMCVYTISFFHCYLYLLFRVHADAYVGQTSNLFNSIYQSISGHLNRKVNENTLDTEILVESAAATKTEQPHARAKNVRM